MKLKKVVWYEGMKLDPHHFQQAEKFYQESLNTRINSLNVNSWGLKEFSIDKAALAGGQFNLTSCSGIMPDGLMIDMPSSDPLPKGRSFDDIFAPASEKMDVFLAVPLLTQGGSNCRFNGSGGSDNTRYILQYSDMPDMNTGSNLRSVGMAKSNFQFKFGDESLDDYSYIKLGEITRASDGRYDMNSEYIPSCLNTSASEALTGIMRSIVGMLVSKSKELKKLSPVYRNLN
jgi:type VI secretion system protein ImpJ